MVGDLRGDIMIHSVVFGGWWMAIEGVLAGEELAGLG